MAAEPTSHTTACTEVKAGKLHLANLSDNVGDIGVWSLFNTFTPTPIGGEATGSNLKRLKAGDMVTFWDVRDERVVFATILHFIVCKQGTGKARRRYVLLWPDDHADFRVCGLMGRGGRSCLLTLTGQLLRAFDSDTADARECGQRVTPYLSRLSLRHAIDLQLTEQEVAKKKEDDRARKR